MENAVDKIKEFLTVDVGSGYGDGYGSGDGSGYGDGYGSGDGYGYGSGDGSGDGYGYGSGDGYGSGSGSGDGSGVKEWQGQTVYKVDGVATLIDSVHGTYAKGRILRNDFTTEDCYIAKVDGRYFAHGETLHKAFKDARNKAFQDMSEEERIEKFKEQYPDKDAKIPAKELFEWHNRLTGSCEMGRRNFTRQHGIDIDHDSFTVVEFINLTKNDFGGHVIAKILRG